MGNHLLTNVSVLDYLMAEGDLYMPFTGRFNHDLTLSSFRSTFADGLEKYSGIKYIEKYRLVCIES